MINFSCVVVRLNLNQYEGPSFLSLSQISNWQPVLQRVQWRNLSPPCWLKLW